MTSPALAFAPGSPAGAAGIAQKAMTGGMPLPNFTSNSSATSGDAFASLNNNAGEFSVNYGSGVLQGAGSVWLIAAVAVVGLLVWKKKSA